MSQMPPVSVVTSQPLQQQHFGRPIVKAGGIGAMSPPAFPGSAAAAPDSQQRLPGQPMPASLPHAPAAGGGATAQRPIVGGNSGVNAAAGGKLSVTGGNVSQDAVRMAEQARIAQLFAAQHNANPQLGACCLLLSVQTIKNISEHGTLSFDLKTKISNVIDCHKCPVCERKFFSTLEHFNTHARIYHGFHGTLSKKKERL